MEYRRPPLETGWLHLLTHLISTGQRLVTSYLATVLHASGEDGTSQTGMRIAGYPATQSALCTLGHRRAILSRRGEQVDVVEMIIRVEERVTTVQQGLHLATHLIIINRCSEADNIGVVHSGCYSRGIVLDNAASQLATSQTATAEGHLLIFQGYLFYLVASLPGATGKLVGQHVAIAISAQARGYYQYFTHDVLLLFRLWPGRHVPTATKLRQMATTTNTYPKFFHTFFTDNAHIRATIALPIAVKTALARRHFFRSFRGGSCFFSVSLQQIGGTSGNPGNHRPTPRYHSLPPTSYFKAD